MGNSPIPFPNANVPILGQICTFHDVQPDVLISCTCDGPINDRLIRLKAWGAVGRCRACGRTMAVKMLAFDVSSAQVKIEIMPVVNREAELAGALSEARETLPRPS